MSKNKETFYEESLMDMIDDGDNSSLFEDIDKISEEIYENDLYAGRTTDSLKGGIFLIACRKNEIPVTADDVSKKLENCEPRDILLAHRYISRNVECVSHLPTSWESFLFKFSDELDLNDETVEKAYEIARFGEESGLFSGRKPGSYAAASIYSAINTEEGNKDSWVTQRVLSDKSNTSESTIRITYQELLSNYNNDAG